MVRAKLRVLLLSLVSAMPGAVTGAEQAAGGIEQRFLGSWELVSYYQFPNGEPARDMGYVGTLIYDAHGKMSGIGMPAPGTEDSAPGRGFAYWGAVSYDTEHNRVIHHVEGSPMVPRWVGQDNIRYYEFTSDGQLKLSLKDPAGRITATLTWRKLP